MVNVPSQSTRTSGRAQNYAKKDAVAISALHAPVPHWNRTMTDNHITLQAHIDKFDRLLKTATNFEESVLRDNRGVIYTAACEVLLTNG